MKIINVRLDNMYKQIGAVALLPSIDLLIPRGKKEKHYVSIYLYFMFFELAIEFVLDNKTEVTE